MLEETHKKIAEQVGKKLKLSSREISLLGTGSTLPDSWGNFPHHSGKKFKIIEGILTSRKLFLKGDDECYTWLGVSLHYIQDRWTLRPRTADKHTQWEYEINKLAGTEDTMDFVTDLHAVEHLLNLALKSDAELDEYYKQHLEVEKRIRLIASLLETSTTEMPKFLPSHLKKMASIFSGMPRTAIEVYIQLIQNLTKLKEAGLEAWFDGGFIVKTMHAAKAYKGIPAAIIRLALLDRPTTWSHTILDLCFAYNISLEIVRHITFPPNIQHPNLQWDKWSTIPDLSPGMEEMFEVISEFIALTKEDFAEIENVGISSKKCWNCEWARSPREKRGFFGSKFVFTCELIKGEVERDYTCNDWKIDWAKIIEHLRRIKVYPRSPNTPT